MFRETKSSILESYTVKIARNKLFEEFTTEKQLNKHSCVKDFYEKYFNCALSLWPADASLDAKLSRDTAFKILDEAFVILENRLFSGLVR